MTEQTNKEKLDSLMGSVNLLFEKLNSIIMDQRSEIEDLENNISKKIEEENNIFLSRLAIIENGINKIYGSQEHIYTTLNNLIVKINETNVSRILNNDSEISEENTIENGASYQPTTAALNELQKTLNYMSVKMHMIEQSQDQCKREYLELLDISKKINQDQANIYNCIGGLDNKECANFENIFTGIDAIKNLIVDQEESINNKIENCRDNSIDYIAKKYDSLFTGVSRLLTNAVDTKEKIDEILKADSKKDEAVCEDNSYKVFCENLEKIYNRKIDFSIYSQDTINWIMECKDDSSKDLDLLKSIVRCPVGSIREIYVDGEPYKFIKINEESKVTFAGIGVPFTDVFHDYVCIDFPKLLQFGSSYDYKTSNVRKWINNEFIQMIEPGVVKYMEMQEVESGGEILMDYVKIPSCTEIGYMNSDIKEGICYNALNPMILNRDGYWLRTGFSLDNVYSINNDNSAVIYTNNQSALHIVPIIRIKESRLPYET